MSTTSKVRRELQSAVAALERHGRVVIVGGPKSGKTFLAHTLLRHFRTSFNTNIIINVHTLANHLDEGRRRILLMDGTLGEVCVDMEEYKVWRALLPRLMTCTDVRHCLVVVTCYPHVLLELQALEEGSPSFLLQDTCTVSLKEMAQDEKKVMLQSFLSDLTMTQQEKHALVERVLKDDISGATFPWCCARLVHKLHNSSLDDPSDVFTAPAESYVTLLHRMLMDPTHGETLAALLCLTMMGLSHFYDNQHNTHTTLTGLGLREISAYTLEKRASFLKNFILSEDCSTFFSRVLYDAAGLALGRSHLLPVLLKICDMDFLVKYARVLVKPPDLFLITSLNSKNSVHLMDRILRDISNGKVIEMSQYLSLQSELFLEKLEKYNRTRKSGEIQLVQAVDTVHGLSLLYWSVWTGCDWLVNWCLDISIKDGKTPPNHLQSAFVWALAERTKSPKLSDGRSRKILPSFETFRSTKSNQVLTLNLPFPPKTLLFSEETKKLYDQVTSFTDLTYLGNPSLPIPPSALITKRKGESFYFEGRSKQVYLALRLLSDTQMNKVDDRDNTLLHVVAEAAGEAFQAGHIDLVSLLLEMGADVNAVNKDGLTALHLICSTGNIHLLTNMIKHGADVHVTDVESRTPLYVACRQGSSQCVSALLDHGADINRKDINGNTPLHAACYAKTRKTVSLLLERGADINAKSADGSTPLHWACENGNTDTATLLLQHGADINAKSTSGKTPLHWACENGNTETAALLLDYGADIKSKSTSGGTPLHWACISEKIDIVVLLLERGADIDAKSGSGRTPLHWASENGNCDTAAGVDINAKCSDDKLHLHADCRNRKKDTAALLLGRGTNIKAKCTDGGTPLHWACKSENTDTVDLLLDYGAYVNARSALGRTPLHGACVNGNTDTAALLLDYGANINAKSTDGTTPLHWACKSENADTVWLLLDRGVDINAKSSDGELPLHWACESGNTDIAVLLLDNGANINAKCTDGRTPLHWACMSENTDTVELLLDHGADINGKSQFCLTPLQWACGNGKKDTAALLLDRGADIKAKFTDGTTSLHWACQSENADTAALLLDRGADINATSADGEQPLHWACENRNTDTAALLLNNGANINAECASFTTPLHWACNFENTDTATLLLDRGADINAKCTDGTTPLHWACTFEKTDAAALLLDRGADINAKTTDGRTPLQWACTSKKIDTAALLLVHGAVKKAIETLLLDREADVNA